LTRQIRHGTNYSVLYCEVLGLERSEFWGIYPWLIVSFHILAVLSALVFSAGVYARMKAWSEGLEEAGDLPEGLSAFGLARLSFSTLFFSGCLLARRSFRISAGRALVLLAIKWSFIVFLAGCALTLFNFNVMGGKLLTGGGFVAFKAAENLAGLLFSAGVLYAILRRLLSRKMPSGGYDYFLLFLLLAIAVTPFVMQGLRFTMDDWPDAAYSPLGLLFARMFSGLEAEQAIAAYNWTWALHAGLALVFVAYIPYSRIFHIFAAQITTAAAGRREKAAGII
jgi:nitrate reductase gamma subunit